MKATRQEQRQFLSSPYILILTFPYNNLCFSFLSLIHDKLTQFWLFSLSNCLAKTNLNNGEKANR